MNAMYCSLRGVSEETHGNFTVMTGVPPADFFSFIPQAVSIWRDVTDSTTVRKILTVPTCGRHWQHRNLCGIDSTQYRHVGDTGSVKMWEVLAVPAGRRREA